jgi:hypothetical protein
MVKINIKEYYFSEGKKYYRLFIVDISNENL